MRKLSTHMLIGQVIILVITVTVGFALLVRAERSDLDRQYELRAGAIAASTAQIPEIGSCLMSAGCGDQVQLIATQVMKATGASYVVVIDMNRVRHSHPFPNLIGQKVAEPIATIDGQIHYTINNGSTGRSANGKAPLYGPDGTMVGEVSVGLRESSVTSAFLHKLPLYALLFGIALAVGAGVSVFLASRLKRRTFGLELDEVAHLLREREAVLHGIREGMIALNEREQVVMINDEARRLTGVAGEAVGSTIPDLIPPGRLRDVLTGEISGSDCVVLTEEFNLTVNRMPVTLAGTAHGSVVTLRDRTELSGLLRELDSVRGLTDALRAQQHEFSNRMHTVAGLLELGEYEEAVGYLTNLSGADAGLAEAVRTRIGSPLVVGLILAKATIASERGIDLELTEDSWLGEVPTREEAISTILGNLIDNAVEALVGEMSGPGRRGHIAVRVSEEEDIIHLRVTDDGPGLSAGTSAEVFSDGYTTKPEHDGVHRGLGLALVHRIVQRMGGRVSAREGPGAEFDVVLPKEAA